MSSQERTAQEYAELITRQQGYAHPLKTIQEITKESLRIYSDGRAKDLVNHPPHYTAHPSGVECIQITEHFTFTLGNAIKYIWRAGLKSQDAIEDLKKAEWYVRREIERLEKQRDA